MIGGDRGILGTEPSQGQIPFVAAVVVAATADQQAMIACLIHEEVNVAPAVAGVMAFKTQNALALSGR